MVGPGLAPSKSITKALIKPASLYKQEMALVLGKFLRLGLNDARSERSLAETS
jgi:hypothetical protein